MSQQGVDGFLVALNDIEHASRKTSLGQPFGNQERRRRITFGWFQDERVPAGKCDRKHPHWHHHGKVKRCNTDDNAKWLAQRVAVDSSAYIFCRLTFQQVRRPNSEFHHLKPASNLPNRIIMGLSMFSGDNFCKLIGSIP